ncbi:F0F1 ATP synthase subunit B [Muriicola sp. Z0-33]|uniref:F0F1 ATP synthase subunit B n=1 Tax=Muriicola sp. Z0-33 TaxID=2816957 RepID=UPI0022380E37|nr:F0F1 ATP synthase subunit B [Muriicola sp. Z0-33]MCW5514619.1 F0F1 ATP synthase subunit B [Muriicola sp. Z0-33]
MDLIKPEIGLIFWTALTFAILLFVLKKFAWKPILGAVGDREDSIKKALAEAENARKEMQNLQADNERILKEARAEREAMLKEARELKDKIVSDAKDQAKVEADKMVKQAQATIEGEKKAAVSEIKSQVANLSVDIAEKVIKEQLANKDKQLKLVEGMLGDIKLN